MDSLPETAAMTASARVSALVIGSLAALIIGGFALSAHPVGHAQGQPAAPTFTTFKDAYMATSSCVSAFTTYEHNARDASYDDLKGYARSISGSCSTAARATDGAAPHFTGGAHTVLVAGAAFAHAALDWSNQALQSGNYTADTSYVDGTAEYLTTTLNSVDPYAVATQIAGGQ